MSPNGRLAPSSPIRIRALYRAGDLLIVGISCRWRSAEYGLCEAGETVCQGDGAVERA
jgi:hypothetical protein